jgi:hypothetical protein
MCKLAIRNGRVDLDACPLLAGLTPACMANALTKHAPDAGTAQMSASADAGEVVCSAFEDVPPARRKRPVQMSAGQP